MEEGCKGYFSAARTKRKGITRLEKDPASTGLNSEFSSPNPHSISQSVARTCHPAPGGEAGGSLGFSKIINQQNSDH